MKSERKKLRSKVLLQLPIMIQIYRRAFVISQGKGSCSDSLRALMQCSLPPFFLRPDLSAAS